MNLVNLNIEIDDKSYAVDVPATLIDEAEDFLLRIRSILHLERGRNLNVLTHELQESVATLFGSPDEATAPQVEALMSTYFHHARIISRALRVSVKALSPDAVTTTAPVEIAEGLERRDNEIWFADATRTSLQPHTWRLDRRTQSTTNPRRDG